MNSCLREGNEHNMTSIVIIAPSIGKTGGAERTAAMLVNALAKSEVYKVTLCVTDSKTDEFQIDNKVEKVVLPLNEGINKNIHRVKALVEICRKRKTKLIVGYTIIGGILACLVKINLYNKIKVIVCERQDPHAFSWIYKTLRNSLYHFSDGAVFQTTEAQKYFMNICKNSVIIPNFIDDRKLPIPSPYEMRHNRILCVGRLEKVKNHDLVIKAFSKLSGLYPKWDLYIYGEGNERTNLEKLVSELALKNRVFLPGYDENIISRMTEAKIFVLASAYEGYPNALLEGLSCGMCCIASDCPCGGPGDMIRNYINGRLIKGIDENSLHETLVECIVKTDESEMMANNAIKIRESNSMDKIIHKWLLYFDSVLETGNKS